MSTVLQPQRGGGVLLGDTACCLKLDQCAEVVPDKKARQAGVGPLCLLNLRKHRRLAASFHGGLTQRQAPVASRQQCSWLRRTAEAVITYRFQILVIQWRAMFV